MKNKKIKAIIIILVLLIVARIAGYFIAAAFMPHRYEGEPLPKAQPGQVRFTDDGTRTPYLAKYDNEGNMLDTDFKVITFGDLHLDKGDPEKTFGLLSEVIEREAPDLVILLGDIILSGDERNQKLLSDFFDEKKLYWCFVPGNHDGEERDAERDESRRWWYESMLLSDYCISFDEGDDEVYGYGNCAINIRTASGISQTLFFMDNSVNGEGDSCYDSSQIAWYEKKVNEIKNENGGKTVPSVIFAHRPTTEYEDAWTMTRKDEDYRIYGDITEEIDHGGGYNEMFETAKRLGSTHAFVCGHEHKNDTMFIFDGIRLIYSQGVHYPYAYSRLTDGTYHLLYALNKNCNWFTEGCTGLIFSPDGQTQIAPSYLPYDVLIKYFSFFDMNMFDIFKKED